jgi:hypothetical protein
VNYFVTLRVFKTFKKVTYYTFLKENDAYTEADKFFNKCLTNDKISEQTDELVEWIRLIGEKYGAKERYFRFENEAGALPPKFVENNQLRLYIYRVNEGIVILSNGGIKTKQTAQECPNVKAHFRFADKMSKQLNALMGERRDKNKWKHNHQHRGDRINRLIQ